MSVPVQSDPELEIKVKKGKKQCLASIGSCIVRINLTCCVLESRLFSFAATERISENMHIVANEPSLAFYRLQEHVRKALPPMVEKRVEVTKLHHELQGRCYDVEYAVG
jgi:hypothetical protein